MEEKLLKKIKKEFSIYEYEKEEAFLEQQAREGWFFKSVSGNTFIFEEDQEKPHREYLIDFYLEALDDQRVKHYNEQGFYLDYFMNSSKEGVWYYFSREIKDNQSAKVHNSEGRLHLLKRVKNRIERFGLVITLLALGFFIFTYIQYREIVYLLAVLFISVVSFYLYRIYRNLKIKIEEMESNT